MALSNADRVKLYLNGKQIQDSPVDKYDMNTWQVPYQPGKLEAVSFKGGKQVAKFVVETTGEPVRLQLIADRDAIAGEGADAVPVTVRVLDSKGRAVENANLPVEFELSGPADIIGLGNGNPNSHEPEKGNKRSLYNGLAQVILQSKANSSGKITLTAKSTGLKDASITIDVKQATQIRVVPVVSPALVLDQWRVSPVTLSRPDPNQETANYDMNSWAPTKPGQTQNINGQFVIFRTTFTPYAEQQQDGAVLLLKNVTGKAEVYVDKKLIATKTSSARGDISIKIPPAQGERTISVLIEAEQGQRVGLGGVVTVQ